MLLDAGCRLISLAEVAKKELNSGFNFMQKNKDLMDSGAASARKDNCA